MLGGALAAGAGWRVFDLWVRARQAARGARASRPYQRPRAGPMLMIFGDSVAAGVGAPHPEQSIAGLLARDHPQASVINHARSGARAADVLAQMATARERAAALWLNVGGNDVLALTPLNRLEADMRAVLAAARQRSDLVVLTVPANFGLAPLFFWPLGPLISLRLRKVRALFAASAKSTGCAWWTSIATHAATRFPVRPIAITRPTAFTRRQRRMPGVMRGCCSRRASPRP